MRHLTPLSCALLSLCLSCKPADGDDSDPPTSGVAFNDLNLAAGTTVLYEVQVRSANACHPDVGSSDQRDACISRVAPTIPYRAQGMSCSTLDELEEIRMGTLDDMLEDTTDYREGITLRYIDEVVGATAVWLMPLFPNNATWDIPDACDNLGSPYAVRDYLHARGTLSRYCIQRGRDEYSDEPCWANEELDELIDEAHDRGLLVMLDVAFNHFGHGYEMYDYTEFVPVRDRIEAGEDLDELWDLEATEEQALLYPEILESPNQLWSLASDSPEHASRLTALLERCPDLDGQDLVIAYNTWRDALDWERDQFGCDDLTLEFVAPGFYLGNDHWNPSTGYPDYFNNDWRDVKFLFHHADNAAHTHEYVREREYLFRIMNYWVSRGVDGFRLDHTTDHYGGMGASEWDYIIEKVNHYARQRGQDVPIYLAEEFYQQQEMSPVVDVMTDGYVHDMCGRDGVTKDAGRVEGIITNMDRFGGRTYVMTALETHDEKRLMDGTGFDAWTGAGFWGIGAATWSTPMLLMGQEFGEPWGLGFRRSDYLRGRFEGTTNHRADGDQLVDFYRDLITERLADENRALYSSERAFLRTRGDEVDARVLAMVKWSDDANVVFAFHNLWEQSVSQSFFIPADLGEQLLIQDDDEYQLVDVFTEQAVGPCTTGADLKWDLYVEMGAYERLQWLRLERCD